MRIAVSQQNLLWLIGNLLIFKQPYIYISGQHHDPTDAVIDLVSVIHESHRIIANSATPLYLYTRYTYVDKPEMFYAKVSSWAGA